jgi:hypothetical protein
MVMSRLPFRLSGAPDFAGWASAFASSFTALPVLRTLAAVFKKSSVQRAHAHRFRHTLATELLGRGASFEEVADILGNSPDIVAILNRFGQVTLNHSPSGKSSVWLYHKFFVTSRSLFAPQLSITSRKSSPQTDSV